MQIIIYSKSACPNCGNKTDFTIHSGYCAEIAASRQVLIAACGLVTDGRGVRSCTDSN